MLRWLAGLAMAALLLMSPEAAVNGAREAMAQWVYAVAPALFPFMALLPLLTCEAALEAYERLLGGLTRRLYDLPGGAAPALAVGMLAGSPAGCAAVKRVAARTPVTRGQARRLAIACCGLSPAFLITGIGAALLGDVGCGHILLRSQIAAQLTLPLLLRPLCRDSTPMPAREAEDAAPPVLAILNVCGYMVLFGAVAAVLGRIAGETLGKLCLLILDVTSGTRIICAMAMPLRLRLVLLSAYAGFGGLCVCAQNLSVLKDVMHPAAFIGGRLAAGALAAAFTALQTCPISVNFRLNPFPFGCFCAALMAIPALYRLKRAIF